MAIPKILHQTWKSKELPDAFAHFHKTWRRQHPDWEFRLYDDTDCRHLIETRFPHLLDHYDSYPTNIQRADFFRYLVVYAFGGVYADLDMECFKSLNPLLAGQSCVFGIEATFGERLRCRLKYPHAYQIANCIFASVAEHPFFGMLLDRLQCPPNDRQLDSPVEDTTGPRFLTRLLQSTRDQFPDITVLPQIHWIPPRSPRYPNCFPFNVHVYCMHHFAGTWKSGLDDAGQPRTLWAAYRERWHHPWPWFRSDFHPRRMREHLRAWMRAEQEA